MGGWVEREAEKRQRTFILNFEKFIVIIFSRSMFGSATDRLLVLCTQLLSYRPGLGSGLSAVALTCFSCMFICLLGLLVEYMVTLYLSHCWGGGGDQF